MSSNRKDDKNTFAFIMEQLAVATKFAAGKAASVLPTQPIQTGMRHRQVRVSAPVDSQVISLRQAYKELIPRNVSGIKRYQPLFRGWKEGTYKEAARGLIKGPVLKNAPTIANNWLSQTTLAKSLSPTMYHIAQSSIAGCISVTAMFCLAPLEGWATFTATAQGKLADRRFLKEVASQPTVTGKIKRAWRGAGVGATKDFATATVMYASADPVNKLVKNQLMPTLSPYLPDKDPSHHPLLARFFQSTIAGFFPAFVGAPLDTIKTFKQKPRLEPIAKMTAEEATTAFAAMLLMWQKHGVRGLGVGFKEKLFLGWMGWGIAAFILEPTLEKPHAAKATDQDESEKPRMKF